MLWPTTFLSILLFIPFNWEIEEYLVYKKRERNKETVPRGEHESEGKLRLKLYISQWDKKKTNNPH